MHTKFLALNADFSSLSRDPLGLRRPTQADVKDGYPLKSGYFIAIGSFTMKPVVDRRRHTITSDEVFNGVNIIDLE